MKVVHCSLLRACNLYTDDHYQMATKNVLPFISNSELFVCNTKFCFDLPFHSFLALERSRPSTPPMTRRARANWLVSPPILSSALIASLWSRGIYSYLVDGMQTLSTSIGSGGETVFGCRFGVKCCQQAVKGDFIRLPG